MIINKIKTVIIFCLVCVTISSCIEETWPELDENDTNSLVVEGYISNYPGPYTIKISTTQALDSIPESVSSDEDFKPVRNAEVSIVDEDGNEEMLLEVEAGIYKTMEGGFQGVIGKSYKLNIISSEGEVYESEYEELLEPIEIDTIYAAEQLVDDFYLGYRFYVTSFSDPSNIRNYKWELEETYEYRVPYKPSHIFDGAYTNAYYDTNGVFHRGSFDREPPHNLRTMNDTDTDFSQFKNCWSSEEISAIYKQTTKYLAEPRVKDFPLNFIYYSHIKLRVRYSLLVHQHSISDGAYKYFSEIEDQNEVEDNQIYTQQPYQLRGNMKNINNPNEVVLGYFYTSAISSKRIFAPIDPRPKLDNVYGVEYCRTADLPSVQYYKAIPINIMPEHLTSIQDNSNAWPVYYGHADIYWPDKMPPAWPVWLVALPLYCIDCRENGGTITRPDYWK